VLPEAARDPVDAAARLALDRDEAVVGAGERAERMQVTGLGTVMQPSVGFAGSR